jgi:hypothetical protein
MDNSITKQAAVLSYMDVFLFVELISCVYTIYNNAKKKAAIKVTW